MDFNNQLYLTKIILDREKIPDFSKYPFIIPVVKNFTELTLDSPVTFFIGENGIGKSTLIAKFIEDKKAIFYTATKVGSEKNIELF